MRKIALILPPLLFLIGLTSLSSNNEETNKLVGVWVYSKYDNQISEFVKKQDFEKDQPGIQFEAGGKLVKRQNVGWCGTPPITYGNYDGHWKINPDSSLTVKYDYWGGKIEENWEILFLSHRELNVKRLSYKTIEE